MEVEAAPPPPSGPLPLGTTHHSTSAEAQAERERRLARVRVEFVEKCLREQNSNQAQYERLVAEIKRGAQQWIRAILRFQALAKTASLIRPGHKSLSQAILAFKWEKGDCISRRACSQLVVNLISVHPNYLEPTLRMLVNHLNARVHRPNDGVPSSARIIFGTSGSEDGVTNQYDNSDIDGKEVAAMHQVLHDTLANILKLRPLAGRFLLPILIARFPRHWSSEIEQRLYVKNLLRITEYAPQLREKILILLIERLVSLDVSADFGSCGGDTNNQAKSILQENPLENKNETRSITRQKEGKAEVKVGQLESKEVKKEVNKGTDLNNQNLVEEQGDILVQKLSAMLEIVLQYLSLVVEKGKSGSQADRMKSDEVFRALLNAFGRSLLKTPRTSCVQHLVFYICSKDTEKGEQFLQFLLARVVSSQVSLDERRSAASFMGGFLVRCRSLKRLVCVSYFRQLIVWAHHYHRSTLSSLQHNGILNAEDGAPHIVFYSVCQAVFYVFTRRFTVFAAMQKDGNKQIGDLGLQTLIGSNLNPLRYISPSVANAVVQSLYKFQIADCKKVLEYNNRFSNLEAVSTFASDKTMIALRQLDGLRHFPFDPCPLKRAQPYLDGLFRTDEELDKEISETMLQLSPHLSPGPSVIHSPFTAGSSPSVLTHSPRSCVGPTPSPTQNGMNCTPPSSQSLPSRSPYVVPRGGVIPSMHLPPSAQAVSSGGVRTSMLNTRNDNTESRSRGTAFVTMQQSRNSFANSPDFRAHSAPDAKSNAEVARIFASSSDDGKSRIVMWRHDMQTRNMESNSRGSSRSPS